jgi:hypothetical protein
VSIATVPASDVSMPFAVPEPSAPPMQEKFSEMQKAKQQ